MTKHARLSASSAHRWMLCPGSVRESEGIPNVGSFNSAEGTLAHDVAARCLTTGVDPILALGRKAVRDGHKVACDMEMVEGVQFYLDTLEADTFNDDEEFIEVDLTPPLVGIHPDLGGTADYARWRPSAQHLRVVDFKYGAGKVVEPTNNKQLLIYALGALLALGKPAKEVTVTIVQPRIEHEEGRVRDWTFPAHELLNFAADVEESASRTKDINAPLVPGDVQCGWCPARHTCPALEAKQHAVVAAEFADLTKLPAERLAAALDMIPLVEARISALREFAYQQAERGNPPPGYKLVAKRPTRKWLSEEAIRTWAESKGIDPFEEPELKSPAQLEKGMSKEQKKEMAEYVDKKSSGNTLVHESDERPAVHKALAQDFALLTEEMK